MGEGADKERLEREHCHLRRRGELGKEESEGLGKPKWERVVNKNPRVERT